MADIAESIPFLSADEANSDDGEQTTMRQVTDFKGVSSNPTDFDIVLDDMPHHQAVQPPPPPPPNQQPAIAPSAYTGSWNYGHATSVQYPQASSINQQQAVIANQPRRMTEPIKHYKVEDYEVLLCLLFLCACCASILFLPLGIVACIFTGLAYDRVVHHKDPRSLLVLAAITTALGFVGGSIGIWQLSNLAYAA